MTVAVLLQLALLVGPTWQLDAQHLAIEAGRLGTIRFDWPKLVTDKEVAPAEVLARDGGVRLTYPGGGVVQLGLSGPQLIARPSRLPPGARTLRLACLLDFGLTDGGRWSCDHTAPAPFPLQKPAKPHLYQGNSPRFRLFSADGNGLELSLPVGTYQQLQDNREWNWKIFAWSAWLPCQGQSEVRVGLSAASGQKVAGLRLDRFGQESGRDWPGKVTSDEDLRADVARDDAYYAGFAKLPRDRFGGLPDSGQALGLKATGYFHVAKVDGRWRLVDPDGNAFYHAGICGFQPSDDYTYVPGRPDLFEWLPPREDPLFGAAWMVQQPYWSDKAVSFYVANLARKYGQRFDLGVWRRRMIDRVRALGFTSVGCFSAITEDLAAKSMPYVSSLPLGTWQLGQHLPGLRGFFDPFDDATVQKIDRLFARDLPARANDPLLIGYYLENEQAAEDIPRVIPALPAGAPAKQALIALLREKYPTIAAFNTAWGLPAGSFDELAGRGLPVTTAAAAADVQTYCGRFLDRYYRVIAEAFHKYDPHHLLLGNRWQPLTANREVLVRTAARYVDVLSLNYYTGAFDEDFLRRLHTWSGDKPWILSEWHYASPSDSGLPGGARELPSQAARGEGYRHYVEHAAALGFVVGHEWFTLIDQARSGRFFEQLHGENGNTGLLSVADRPWRALVEAAAQTHARIYDVQAGRVAPYQSSLRELQAAGGGRRTVLAAHLTKPLVVDGRGDEWPVVPPQRVSEERLTAGSQKVGFEAGFRVAWNEQHLALWAEVTDPTPRRNEQTGADLWNADALELFVGHEALHEAGPLRFTDRQILIGTGPTPRWHIVGQRPGDQLELAVVSRVDGAGYVVELAIPWATVGVTPKPGLTLLFDLGADDSDRGRGRQRQIMWSGGERNSADRSQWGRLSLSE